MALPQKETHLFYDFWWRMPHPSTVFLPPFLKPVLNVTRYLHLPTDYRTDRARGVYETTPQECSHQESDGRKHKGK